MSAFDNYTTEEIEAELRSRREGEALIPKHPSEINWDRVRQSVIGNVTFLKANGREEPDHEHWTWEEVMVAVYGKDVWKTYNKMLC